MGELNRRKERADNGKGRGKKEDTKEIRKRKEERE